MPVELPPEDCGEQKPSQPSLLVWFVVLIVTMVVGAWLALKRWPTDDPANTVRFWIHVIGIPFAAWAIAFGLRAVYWGQECERIDAENVVARERRNEAIRFACEPLAVLGYAYLTGAGASGVSTSLRNAEVLRAPLASGSENEEGPCRVLGLVADDEDPGRYQACFREIIPLIAAAVDAIPEDVPFEIRLHAPAAAESASLLKSWAAAWKAAGLRPTRTSRVAADRGLMELDEWLDLQGGPRLERCVLHVAVRLRDNPADQGAEAVSAVVLGWAPLARRERIRVLALMHRPVEGAVPEIERAVARASMWARTSLAAMTHVWQAGVSVEEKAAIAKCVDPASPKTEGDRGRGGIHDITAQLGDVGMASSWLAVVLAIEAALEGHGPQLIACREDSFRCAVVRPDSNAATIQMDVEA